MIKIPAISIMNRVTHVHTCGVCRSGVGDNAILCTSCKKWIHKKCSRVVGRLKKGGAFKCSKCSEGGVKVVDEVRQLVLGAREELEVVDKFCYLGDVIGRGGGAEEASRARVRCAWGNLGSENVVDSERSFIESEGKDI